MVILQSASEASRTGREPIGAKGLKGERSEWDAVRAATSGDQRESVQW